MKTKVIFTILATIVLLTSIIAAPMLIPANDKAKENAKGLTSTPHSLEKVVFIHYKKGYGRVCDNNGICEPGLGENPSCSDCKKDGEEGTCYALLDKWAKWEELSINYVINPTNSGLTEDFVAKAISAGAEEWDAHTSSNLFETHSINESSIWNDDAPDGMNDLLFGDYQQDGVIAVTIVWGYFCKKPSNRRIVEFDVLFDTDYTWGDVNDNSTVMDLQNIATHELGHSMGLDDLYTVCREETMYGYSKEGEKKKRSLNAGDIAGINMLYS